jgi:mediator of RNA polymerase II transcription subunit 6
MAASLPDFSPAADHTYLPPGTANKPKDTHAHRGSKEATPLPEGHLATATKKQPVDTTYANSHISALLLDESLALALRYGDEYMDENPITGHPGDFHLTTTGRNKDKLSVPVGKAIAQSKTGTPVPVVKTEPPGPARKGSKKDKSPKISGMPKPKRRKSKAAAASGTVTPS